MNNTTTYQKYKHSYDKYYFNEWLNNAENYVNKYTYYNDKNKNKKRIRNKISREEYLKRYDIKKNGANIPIKIFKCNITLYF